jgi:hypothetical protein
LAASKYNSVRNLVQTFNTSIYLSSKVKF